MKIVTLRHEKQQKTRPYGDCSSWHCCTNAQCCETNMGGCVEKIPEYNWSFDIDWWPVIWSSGLCFVHCHPLAVFIDARIYSKCSAEIGLDYNYYLWRSCISVMWNHVSYRQLSLVIITEHRCEVWNQVHGYLYAGLLQGIITTCAYKILYRITETQCHIYWYLCTSVYTLSQKNGAFLLLFNNRWHSSVYCQVSTIFHDFDRHTLQKTNLQFATTECNSSPRNTV